MKWRKPQFTFSPRGSASSPVSIAQIPPDTQPEDWPVNLQWTARNRFVWVSNSVIFFFNRRVSSRRELHRRGLFRSLLPSFVVVSWMLLQLTGAFFSWRCARCSRYMDVARVDLSPLVVLWYAHRWVPKRLLTCIYFFEFMLTRFKERVLKFSAHPGWLCHPRRPAAPSPSALKAVCPWRKNSARETKAGLGWLLAGNLCANSTTVCINTRGTFGRQVLRRCPRGGNKAPSVCF